MSQNAEILRDLRRGKRITPLDALKAYGSLRLGARIFELRKRGIPVKKRTITDRKGRKSYAEYFI